MDGRSWPARSSRRFDDPTAMEGLALSIFREALRTAVMLMLPVIAAVALVGIIIGAIQTIVQVQDQNVAFAPKIAVVAMMIVVAGPLALTALQTLLVDAIAVLPHLARS
jgi:flagellar biosynthetic protein FliQ